jgi:predicted O-methyltransferase YrrM
LFLELGTGAGLGTASLLSGMSSTARLVTVELSEALSLAAQEEINDPRVAWVIADGGQWLEAGQPGQRGYDLVFADSWPGKFTHLDEALGLVAVGGFYVVDDLFPQPNWPPAHRASVDALTARLADLPRWHTVRTGPRPTRRHQGQRGLHAHRFRCGKTRRTGRGERIIH